MELKIALCIAAVAVRGAAFAGGYPYSPAALNDVKVTGGFWLPRVETNRLVTVKTDFRKCEVTGKRSLLDVAIKNADLVAKTFGLGEGQSHEVPGHEEIEIGLCRLYQATGDAKYLKLAQHFVDMRGRKDLRPVWGAAYQDHRPVLEQKEALGHAVRAAYLYAGMADVAALTGNTAYVDAIDALWENVVGRKLHLNGGIGARRHVKYRDPALGNAHEAFGDEYDLQNLDAYLETCAAIGNALWNERMFLLHGDAKYIAVMERTLYNGLISGVSIGGDEFFYPNPLASKGGYKRSKWFGCSCCPVNVVRFIPQIGRFAYATKRNAAYVNLFVESEATLRLASGEVKLAQKTAYPWKGGVRIEVTPNSQLSTRNFQLCIRLPGWCVGRPVPSDLYEQVVPGTLDDFRVTVNGAAVKVVPVKGYCVIDRAWKAGDVVEVAMNMTVRRVKANDKVAADRGRAAVERGPIVVCAEGIDNGGKVLDACLPLNTTFTEGEIEIASTRMVSLTGGGLTLVPYFAWCHRGAGEMQTWFAASTEATEFRIRLKCRPKRSAGIVEIRTR